MNEPGHFETSPGSTKCPHGSMHANEILSLLFNCLYFGELD